MSNYWKKKLDELEKENNPSGSYWDRKAVELKNEELRRKAFIKQKEEEEDDIAPIKSKEDDGKLDFFQKSSLFDDGWDFGDITKTILGSVGDAGVNAVKGVGGLVEGITDLASYGVAGVADAIGKDSFADDLRKKTQASYVDKLMKPAEDYLDKSSILGRTSDAILQGVGQIGGIMATGGLGAAGGLGAGGVTALTTGVMGLSGMGSGMGEAYKGGATDEEATLYGAISGTADAISELIFGGLGKAVNAVGLSRGLSSADDMLAKKVSSMFSNQIMKNLSEFGIKAGAEGLEEVLAGIAQAAGKKATYMSEEEFGKILKDENLLEQFVVGAVASGIAQAPGLHIANKTGSDFITGLSQNEQAVVKKEIENRIAEAEADGTKLTAKEKAAIEAQVEKDLEKGYISTDTIESVLSGDSYKSWQQHTDIQTKLQEQIEKYENLPNAEITVKQAEQLKHLRETLAEQQKQYDTKNFKSILSEKAKKLVSGTRLAESYNEKARRGQAYEADLTKYDEKQKAVIQKAVESGILNNTNRTHEFVDMVAKISADKGVLFDFTNNEKLKESGFAVDGKFVNGYWDKKSGTIGVNVSSAKALNTIVGHEITHVLEGTGLYNDFQKIVVEYAKAKGDYQGRMDALNKLYDAKDVPSELTADLVGDYLFTDSDFVNNLSTNHRNVFQKIYDEVKYLLKVATAGSKEARQLEKVKMAFEKAYRESSQVKSDNDSDTKYSLVTDEETINFLDNQEQVKVYRAMQVIDGELYPPMAARVKDDSGKKQLVEPTKKNAWYQADERPELMKFEVKQGKKKRFLTAAEMEQNASVLYGNPSADDVITLRDGSTVKFGELGLKFELDKANGSTVPAAYNPYFHTSLAALNDQFSSAYNRPNLVVVEGYIPKSELTSGYKALYAKDSVGETTWHSGPVASALKGGKARKVFLSRWFKVGRIVSDTEAAGEIAKVLDGENLSVPWNVVTPSLRKALEAKGVSIDYKDVKLGSNTVTFASTQTDTKYSLSPEQQEFFKDSVVRDENGNLKVMYHGTSRGGFNVFDTYGSNYGLFGTGSYFTDSKTIGESYTKKGKGKNPQVYEVYLNIKNPMDMDAAADPAEWANAFPDADFPESGTNEQFYRAVEEFYADQWMSKWEVAEEIQAGIESNMGYDGITHIGGGRVNPNGERHQVYIAFQPEQIKSVANEKPSSDPDIRFSLSEAVEETKDLVALHNLTADKLTKSLELGGLPMPSLAITKADIPHSNFGDITLIFDRKTIDPKASKKNKVYSADAWTPVFPRVEYEADSKVGNRISQKLSELGNRIDDYFQSDLRRVNYGFDDYLNSQGGEEGLIRHVMDNYGLKAAYLEEQGKHIEKVTKQEEAEKGYNPDAADKYNAVMDILGVTTAEEISTLNLKDVRDNHGAELEAVYPGMTKTAMRLGRLLNVVKSYLENKDSGPVYNTVIDGSATKTAVDNALDAEGYEAWVRNLFSGIVKDSGIYNNKDLFTPSGNRRSFKQTHLPVTLENIVKAMASQNDGKSKNVSGFNGIKTLRASTAETFKSVAEMHQRKGRLKHLTQEEADALNDSLQSRLFEIMRTIDNEGMQSSERNPYIRLDSIGETISEIGESGKYNVADIQKTFRQYGKEISDDTALAVKQLLYDVTQMPVNIFEAKPQRVVSFEEAKVFVIPNNADVKLKQELLNRGYNIAEYDPNVEGDRQKVVNQFEEFKFSLSDAGAAPKTYGSYNVYGKDIALEAVPVQEEVAPVAGNATPEARNATPNATLPTTNATLPTTNATSVLPNATVSETESVAPVAEESSVAEMFPDDLAPVQQELDNLLAEQTELRQALETAMDQGDYNQVSRLTADYEAVTGRIRELQAQEDEQFSSLSDADMPPEAEAPYPGEPNEPADPFAERDIVDVGNRSVKAYQYENPEVKPFFTEAALGMLYDLRNGTKGEKIFNGDVYYQSGGEEGWMGTKRQTTADISELLDTWNYTYDQIEKGLNAIIEDDGKENNAVSKRIEFMLNDRLMNGYTGVWGEQIPANQEYINLLNEKQITEYSREAFDRFMATADQYAPPAQAEDIAPVQQKPGYVSTGSEQMKLPLYHDPNNVSPAMAEVQADEDIAPVFETESGQQAIFPDADVPKAVTRKELHASIIDKIKTKFAERGFDLDAVLKNARNLSTFSTVDNIPQRVMEKALGYKEGGILADFTVNKVAQNETQGIKWLNSFTDRKNGLLAQISKRYNIKPGSKESAAAQMYAEGFYVGKNNEIISYGDRELALDFPDPVKQAQIKGLARDPRIRKIYDDTLKAINESRTRNAYPEIPRLDNYFLHFRAMNDTFSQLGLPFNPNDIKAKDLPTDLNGMTVDLKPGQPFFASAMHREGKRTDFDLLGGLEQYLTSAKNQIYHIDDIQNLRALRNYIADIYGQAHGLEDLDELSQEAQFEHIKKVYNSHLSTFAKFLHDEANVLAGKTDLLDRAVEGRFGRRGLTFLDTLNRQVGANMVGYNISSSLTNLLAPVQAFAKTNKAAFIKGFAQFASNKVNSIHGNGDGFAENSPVMIRRKGAERFHRTFWQKMSDPGYVLMSAVDDISTEIIARAKYNELTRKGMDSQTAHFETDKWVSRLMGDRSLGQQPQLYNSKMLGIITKFQLEVRNQLDSQFYDTIQEAKVSNEDIQNGLLKNAKTAAKVGSTFFQLAVAQHLFGKAFESIAGYNPAFDIISAIIKTFGWDDDEEDEDTVLDNIEQGFFELMGDMPYVSTFTGGRIPIESALPIEELYKGKDQYGNEKSRWETLGEAAPYYLLPGGYGQIKKTVAGMDMFSDEHPIAGSYTDSGNLRFPVDDTLANRAQAAVFGQYASGNARDYFDNERSALKPKQIQEFIDVGMSIQDYWKYRDGLSGLSKLEEKINYINSLNLTTAQKNVLVNNLTDRKEAIDMADYDQYSSLEEFDYANKNPEKYAFFEEIGITYETYRNADDDAKKAYDWALENPDKYPMSKAIASDVVEYRRYTAELYDIKADKDSSGKSISGSRKEKVLDYINSLDIDYGAKLILFKNEYNADDESNQEIIDYLNGRSDISFEEEVAILRELGFTVTSDGTIYWD